MDILMRPVPPIAWVLVALASVLFLIRYTSWYQRIADHPYMKTYRIVLYSILIIYFTVQMLQNYDIL